MIAFYNPKETFYPNIKSKYELTTIPKSDFKENKL